MAYPPSEFARFGVSLHDRARLMDRGIDLIWTSDQMLEYASGLPPHSTLGFMPLLGGLAPEAGWACLRLLEKTMPRLQALRA